MWRMVEGRWMVELRQWKAEGELEDGGGGMADDGGRQ